MYYAIALAAPSRKHLQGFVFFAGDNIYTDIYEGSNPNYIRVCDQSAIKLLTTILKTCVLFNLVVVCLVPPFYLSNEIQLPVPVLVPFTDLESSMGIIINLCNQCYIIPYASIALLGIEITNCLVKNAIWAVAVAICFSVDELTAAFKDRTSASKRLNNFYFRNMLIQVQDLDRYEKVSMSNCI